jgi:hypothetical protein
MEKLEYATEVLDLLCAYVGDDKVFESLIDRWGVEEVFNIVSDIFNQTQTSVEEEEDD